MQLHHFRTEFEKLGVQVFIVGFEEKERARNWLQRAKVDFPFLLDPDRSVYRAYGLERSVVRSWHPRNLWFYLKRLVRGKAIPIFRADPFQMGGDLIIDRSGTVFWTHTGMDAMDRPSAKQILGVLENVQ